MSKPLPIPPAAERDPQSQEMIRVWLAEKKVHCVLNIGHWEGRDIDERKAWGILLADMLHHIANAHHERYERDPQESIEIIKWWLTQELAKPTSKRVGEFVANPDRSDN